MDTVFLKDISSNSKLEIDPLGFNALSLFIENKGRIINLLYKEGAPILFPWPNRLLLNENGEFTWEDSLGEVWDVQVFNKDIIQQSLTTDNEYKKSVRHGFARNIKYGITGKGEDFVKGKVEFSSHASIPDFYEGLSIEVMHSIQNNVWRVEANVRNNSSHEIPVGYCVHYWFNTIFDENSLRSKCRVTLPADKYWESNEVKFPSGALIDATDRFDFTSGREIGTDNFYDHVFYANGNTGYVASLDIPYEDIKIKVTAGEDFKNIVFYCPEEKPETICIEPQTCCTDVFNMLRIVGRKANLLVLKPNNTKQFSTSVCWEV